MLDVSYTNTDNRNCVLYESCTFISYIVYTSGCLLIPAHENKSCLGAENLTCDVH